MIMAIDYHNLSLNKCRLIFDCLLNSDFVSNHGLNVDYWF